MGGQQTSADILYLSPHLDDAVLSCGGTIHQQTQAGQKVVVLTIFAGSPTTTARTPFASELEARWGAAEDAIAVRRTEDAEALGLLGAAPIHWPYEDCIYRRSQVSGEALYPTQDAIFGTVHPRDPVQSEVLAVEIETLWRDLGRPQVYAMLGAGNHVDHQIVAAALMHLLQRQSIGVVFYEDYPYAEDQAAVQVALERLPLPNMRAETRPLAEGDLEAKLDAIACYRSQIEIFWQDVEDMRASVRAHALRTGDAQLAEAYWRSLGFNPAGEIGQIPMDDV